MLTREKAEEIALFSLGWLAGNDELLPVFLAASGASLEDLKNGATDPAILASVLDFLMMDDRWVIECCTSLNQPFEVLQMARHMLPGGDLPNWT